MVLVGGNSKRDRLFGILLLDKVGNRYVESLVETFKEFSDNIFVGLFEKNID